MMHVTKMKCKGLLIQWLGDVYKRQAIDLMLMGKRDWNRYINSMISHKLRLIEEEKYEEIENINRMIDKEIRDFKEYYDE